MSNSKLARPWMWVLMLGICRLRKSGINFGGFGFLLVGEFWVIDLGICGRLKISWSGINNFDYLY